MSARHLIAIATPLTRRGDGPRQIDRLGVKRWTATGIHTGSLAGIPVIFL